MWACEGREEPREGRNEEAKGAPQKNKPQFSLWLIFAVLIFHPPHFELLTLPPGQNDIRSPCHHHHLPRVQTRAGGGPFRRFDATPTTTTSLTSKCEPEVVDFSVSTRIPPPPPPSHPNASRRWSISVFRREPHHYHLASKRESEVVPFGVLMRTPPPPPPSLPNASRRWSISAF